MANLIFTVVGYAIGGPIGALIGGFLATILFPPPAVKGPRINELNLQTSTVGAPVTLVIGTYPVAGNVIWSGGLIETKHSDEVGGFLGIGGQEVVTYTYSVDVAIGVAEGPITGIRRVWADADLIYDSSDDETLEERLQDMVNDITEAMLGIRAMSAQLDFTVYTGTADQLPDPTIESYEVPGTVPAYRGLAYVVFRNFQLEKYGNRIPNFRFEVFSGAFAEPVDCTEYSPGHLEPWQYQIDNATYDPRNRLNIHYYNYSGGSVTQTFEAAMNDAEADYGCRLVLGEEPQGAEEIYVKGWYGNDANWPLPCYIDHPSADSVATDYVVLRIKANFIEDTQRCGSEIRDFVDTDQFCADWWAWVGGDFYVNPPTYVTDGALSGYRTAVQPDNPEVNCDTFFGCDRGDSTGTCDSHDPVFSLCRITDQTLQVTRSIQPYSCPGGIQLSYAPGWCVNSAGQLERVLNWTRVDGDIGDWKALAEYTRTGPFGVVTQYPLGPSIHISDPRYDDQAFWEAAYAAQLAAQGGGPSPVYGVGAGWVYGVDYPEHMDYAYFPEGCEADIAVPECVPMATAVSLLCARVDLRTDTDSQIDTSDLTTCVPGYAIGRQMSCRDALIQLRTFGLWDCVESGPVLKFIERGHAIAATLTDDDLGAHEHGSEAPSKMEVTRVQEKDLPRRLRLHFPNLLHDHEPSEQAASRITTEAVSEVDVELAVSMEPDDAAQLAEILLYSEWVGRNTYRFVLDHTWLHLEPTDCIEIPVDGFTTRVRIVSIDYSTGGLLRVEAVADDDGSYVSTATARPSEPSGGGIGGPGRGPVCPSGIVLLDLPPLTSTDIDAGYRAAVWGYCDSWACAELYRSSDGGVTYGRVARFDDEATVGEITDITGPPTDPAMPGDSPLYDSANTITVNLFNGELASVTDAQIDAGANLAAIGADGRWLLVQFKTATFDTGDTWVLTDLVWGVNDTRHLLGTVDVDDTFVLLSDAAVIRVPESADAIGVEKQFKIVTCGEAVADVDPFDFTTWGLSYRRPCPSTVISATTVDPPDDAVDGDAYLLPDDTSLSGPWADHGGEVAFWSDETGSWNYCTPAPGTIIHVTGSGDTSATGGGDGGDVISGGDGTYTGAPWTPAVPPLPEHPAPTGENPDDLFLPVWNEDEQRYVRTSLTTLRAIIGPGIAVDGRWRFDAATAAADPGAGDVRVNNATPASVTEVYFSQTTLDGFDSTTLFGRLGSGHRFYLQQTDDADRSILFEVDGTPTDEGAWWTVPVTVVDAGMLYTANRTLTALFLLVTSGGGNTTATYVTVDDESAGLPNSRRLVGGTGVTLTDSPTANELEIAVAPVGIPQNAQPGDYTILAADNGHHLFYASGSGPGDTYTLDLDGTGIAAGFAVTIISLSANALDIAAVNGTLRWIGSGAGVTGTRTLAQYGHATIIVNDTGDEAVIDGALLT